MPKKLSQSDVNLDVDNDIIDLDLSVTKKKKFRFDKDNSRILELNVSDMGILERVSVAYPKLKALQEKAGKLMDGISSTLPESTDDAVNEVSTIAERLKKVDAEMRELIDYMFAANVSEVAAPDGSMYDPFEGSFRFEYIITLLIGQYEANLKKEYAKVEKQFNKHTSNYTKGR